MTGKQLKDKIKQKGIKFTTLAEMLSVAPQQVQQYFNTQNVSTEVLERIADVVGESVSKRRRIIRKPFRGFPRNGYSLKVCE